MFTRLPYRLQIPVGLSLAVLITAILMTAVLAKVMALTAEQETSERINRASVLVVSQARSLIAAEDVWRTFTLLRSTTALLPGADDGLSHVSALDKDGYVFASSNPTVHSIGQKILGNENYRVIVPQPNEVQSRITMFDAQNGKILIEPVRSEDGKILGFIFIEVDSAVFMPAWLSLFGSALVGSAITAFILIPIGWYIGQKMAKPVAELVHVIEKIGKHSPHKLRPNVPLNTDPELRKIGYAVLQLLDETETRQKAQARAFSSQRLAAVGRITAVVAHEINNPLAGLMTATKTLRLHEGVPEIRRKSIELIERGLNQISATVNALLPQARLQNRNLTIDDLFDMTTLVEPTAQRFQVNIQVNNRIEYPLGVPSGPMRQVMLNLLLNAIKASGNGGEVWATLISKSDSVEFEVINTGNRLTEELLQAAIATESDDDPRGFGLWVCHQIATQFSGSLSLDSSEENYTRLVFKIPNQNIHESTAIN